MVLKFKTGSCVYVVAGNVFFKEMKSLNRKVVSSLKSIQREIYFKSPKNFVFPYCAVLIFVGLVWF